MDSNNVISITNDIEELERDMSNWQNLTYDEKKRADIHCYEKNGCNNIELFNRIKADIIKNTSSLDPNAPEEKSYMNEKFSYSNANDNYAYDSDELSDDILLYKIQTSEFIQKNDKNVVIIPDAIEFEWFTLDYIDEQIGKYISLSPAYKDISNGYSLEIWGMTVPEMYNYMKGKLTNEKVVDELPNTEATVNVSLTDKLLMYYEDKINNDIKNKDFIDFCCDKIDCESAGKTTYENSVLSSITNKEIKTNMNYNLELPPVVPYFTYDEYQKYNETDVNPFNYAFIDNGKNYFDTIKSLQEKGDTDSILKLGWNPAIPINGETITFARKRQAEWFNIHEQCNIVDISDYSTLMTEAELNKEIEEETKDLQPVFISLIHQENAFGKMINWFKRSMYSHAGIALDSKLNKIYSFNIHADKDEDGVCIEKLDDYNDQNNDCNLLVMCIFVSPEVKYQIQKSLDWYMTNQNKTSYSIKNIGRIVINKPIPNKPYSLNMVCSQFVDTILKMSNIDITDKNSNLVSPHDLVKSDEKYNVFVLFEGKKKNYDYKKVDNNIKALKQNMNYKRLAVADKNGVVRKLREHVIESLSMKCEENNPKVKSILEDIKQYTTPKEAIVISEAKADPNAMTYDDLKNSFKRSKETLAKYNESEIIYIKYELCKLFYLYHIIDERLIRNAKTSKEHDKKLIELKEEIIALFKKYHKIVVSVEPNFDFVKHIQKTRYYKMILSLKGSKITYTYHGIKNHLQNILHYHFNDV